MIFARSQMAIRPFMSRVRLVVIIRMGAAALSTCFSSAAVSKPGATSRSKFETMSSFPHQSDMQLRKGELPGILEEEGDSHIPQLLPSVKRKRASKGLAKKRSQYHVSPRIC